MNYYSYYLLKPAIVPIALAAVVIIHGVLSDGFCDGFGFGLFDVNIFIFKHNKNINKNQWN